MSLRSIFLAIFLAIYEVRYYYMFFNRRKDHGVLNALYPRVETTMLYHLRWLERNKIRKSLGVTEATTAVSGTT